MSVEETKKKIEAIEKERRKPNLKPEQIAEIDNRSKAASGDLANLARQFEQRAEQFKAALPQSEARARMLYDAAWAYRAAGADAAPAYTKLIAEFPDLSWRSRPGSNWPNSSPSRKPDDAIKLLKDAIDKEPTDKPTPPETLERIRLRLGGVLFDKKDYAAAQGQFDAVAANEKSPHRGQGLYRSAECLLAQGKADEAAKKLVDLPRQRGVPQRRRRERPRGAAARPRPAGTQAVGPGPAGVRDGRRSLRQQQPVGGGRPLRHRAALQNQGRFDEAVNAYAQVTQTTQDDRAGRAHCRSACAARRRSGGPTPGKEFETVYYGFDLPDLKFAAMLEHARVLVEEKKPDEAMKLLEKRAQGRPEGQRVGEGRRRSGWTRIEEVMRSEV